VERWRAQLEESVARYLSQLDAADRQGPTEALAAKVTRLTEKLTRLKEKMGKLAVYEKQMLASPDQQISLTDPEAGVVPAPSATACRSPCIPSTICL
jgi:hypothetical protein